MSKLACAFLCIVGATAAECEDAMSGSSCHTNIQWARETGFSNHPAWYENFPITSESPVSEWQCVLYTMEKKPSTPAEQADAYPPPNFGCTYPCTFSQLCPKWGIDENLASLMGEQDDAYMVAKINTIAGFLGLIVFISCFVGMSYTCYHSYTAPAPKKKRSPLGVE